MAKNVVGPRRTKGLKESDNNHDEVDVEVNGIQKDESRVGTVNETEQESKKRQAQSQPKAWDLFKVDGIVKDGDEGFQKGKGRVLELIERK